MRALGIDALPEPVAAWPDLQMVIDAGWFVWGECLFLAAYRSSTSHAPRDTWGAERFVNKVSLHSSREATDPARRAELGEQGISLALALLRLAGPHSDGRAMQATVSLQSASAAMADPEIDFATGAVHIYVLREPHDYVRPLLEGYRQPVAALTRRGR